MLTVVNALKEGGLMEAIKGVRRADGDYRINQELSILNAISVAKENKERLAELAMHPMTLRIVAMTIGRTMTVQELSERLGISMVACYKVVENLAELGFLAEAGKVRTSTHGRALGYTSIVKNGYINIRDGCIEICCNYKDGFKCFQQDFMFEDESPDIEDEPDAVVEIHFPKGRKCHLQPRSL